MGFRIKTFSVNEEKFTTPKIAFNDNSSSHGDNFFSIIIGNNGTGKSRFLSYLVDAFIEVSENKRRSPFEYKLEYSVNGTQFGLERVSGQQIIKSKNLNDTTFEPPLESPAKVIALTTSISDRFPQDDYARREIGSSQFNEKFTYYRYLGPKSRMNMASSRALMDRAVKLMLTNIDFKLASSYRSLFKYLDYEPVIKFTYHVSRLRDSKDVSYEALTGSDLKKCIADNIVRTSDLRARSLKRSIDEFTDLQWDRLAIAYKNAYFNSRSSNDRLSSFTLNFSQENFLRDSGIGDAEREIYSDFEELRRLDLVRGPSIKLYKRNGGEFDFSDASSGEASILSSLIGLIPCLTDNALIVIDEPEISLHPSWQYQYVSLIDKLLTNHNGCHIIIATHSHFIISDLPPGRSSVIHFQSSGKNSIHANYIDEDTHGWSAEDILLSVFDMPSTRNYYLSKLLSEALELMAMGKKSSPQYLAITNKLKVYLPNMKDIDPAKKVIQALISTKDNNENENQ